MKIWLLLLLSCAPDKSRAPHYVLPDEVPVALDTAEEDTGVTEPVDRDELPRPPDSAVYLRGEPVQVLRRASLDLRGVLPTEAELLEVSADPDALELILDAYVEDARLEERLVHVFADQWLTRIDRFEVLYTDYFLTDEEEHLFERSVGEEPARLMARVAVEDRPWTDIVTTDTTMANELLGEIWPIDYPDGETGWQEVRYTDGRPGVGVLTTNAFHWRYVTNYSNRNRSRAVAISQLVLCEDILARPVSFSGTDGLSVDDTENAMNTNPYCVSCHASLEPVAALFFGFFSPAQYTRIEYERYHAEREQLWRDWLSTSPAWYGQPLSGLVDLGPHIAADPRFRRCAVENMVQGLWQRSVQTWDFAVIEELRQDFEAADMRMKPLIRSILETSAYQAVALDEALATDSLHSLEITTRMMGPALFGAVVEDTFGYAWTYAGFDQLGADGSQNGERLGYRTLMGGVNGDTLTRAQSMPGLTWAITVKRVAQVAGAHAAIADLETSDGPGVLTLVTAETLPEDPAFVAQLEATHMRMFATAPTEEWLEAVSLLWTDMAEVSDPVTAWGGVLSVMIRDPRFLTY